MLQKTTGQPEMLILYQNRIKQLFFPKVSCTLFIRWNGRRRLSAKKDGDLNAFCYFYYIDYISKITYILYIINLLSFVSSLGRKARTFS